MREQLRARLTEVWPELEIIGEAKNGEEAVAAVEQLTPDLAFLDIRMPGMTGIEAAKAIGDACHIVFITAYNEYAVDAFEQGVVDYVLKPAERERLEVTVARLKKRLGQRPSDLRELLGKLASAPRGGRIIRRPLGRPAAMDPGQRGPAVEADSGSRRAVFHVGREVHARSDRNL